ncbi:MAG TPA: c-type cytochrome biogenesis protein CcmI [Gammaproteobacteria bacterium]|nr:c-type cytochrome biogenesis protein CcmI [Gammaproteobacteria bacterium]
MTVFVAAALLLVVAALVFVIPPLLQKGRGKGEEEHRVLNISVYRDQMAELERDREADVISQEQYEQGRLELEKRLLEDVSDGEGSEGDVRPAEGRPSRAPAIAVGIFLPVFAAGVYLTLGTPDALNPEQAQAPRITPDMSQEQIADQINLMVAQLAKRLEDDPTDAEGWAMLGRSLIALERFDEALSALENATRLNDGDAQLFADYADALAMAGGQSLEGRPMELIRKALEIDPNNQKALWLAGTAAYERADFEEALKYWEHLYQLVPKGSQAARSMESNIAEVKALLAGRDPNAVAEAQPAPAATMGQASDAGAGIEKLDGVVSLDSALQDRVDGSDTVFIFARAPQGPRMPLAIIRAQASDLPMKFTLDDSTAINPAMKLSMFSQVEVVARISRSGDATPKSGDLQGSSGIVGAGSTADIVVDEVIP